MINLIVKDGLGNQMFQYAYARCLQEQYRHNGIIEHLQINPYFIDHRNFEGNDQRRMSLQHLYLNSEVTFTSQALQKKEMRMFELQTLLSVSIPDLIKWRIKKQQPLGEKAFSKRAKRGIYYAFTPYTNFHSPLSKTKNKYIFGFFQTEWNFMSISDIIKKELLVKDEPSSKNAEMLALISHSNSVCLHIRRGDYLNPKWKNLQICNFDYYNNCIQYILQKIDNPTFFVFSNTHEDLEWIKTNYHFIGLDNKPLNIIYVDLSNPDYEELRLMYNCKYFIISNSTFSWWGAYLSSYKDKIVLVPERWNLSDDSDYKVYLTDWIKISNK